MVEPSDESQSTSSEEASRPEPPKPAEQAAAVEAAPTEDVPVRGVVESQDTKEVEDIAPAGGPGGSAPFMRLHVGGRGLAHALPSPVWLGTLGIELWFDRQFAIDLSALASTIGDSRLAGAHAETWLAGGELLGCSALKLRDFEAQGCVGAVLAACRASGQGYSDKFPAATLLWAASTLRLALRWPAADRVSVRFVIQGHVNVVRPELRINGSSEQLYPFWLGGSAGLDLIVRWNEG
jgi:hypothetical protein